MERKVGTAYFNLGRFKEADIHLRKALKLMGIIIPEEKDKVKPVKKVNNLNLAQDPKEKLNNTEFTHRKREAVIVLLALARVNFYASRKLLAIYCSSLALSLSGNNCNN